MTGRSKLARATSRAFTLATASGALLAVVQSIVGQPHPAEAIGGALFGATFFAITAVVGLLLPDRDLKSGLLMTYVFKFSMLIAALLLVPVNRIDRPTVAIAVVLSATVYLTVSTVMLGRRRPSA